LVHWQVRHTPLLHRYHPWPVPTVLEERTATTVDVGDCESVRGMPCGDEFERSDFRITSRPYHTNHCKTIVFHVG
jgi:hypothetical protein